MTTNLRNRVGRLIEETAKHGDQVSASTDSHPWYLNFDKVLDAEYERVRQRCDEVAATLQIELAGESDAARASQGTAAR